MKILYLPITIICLLLIGACAQSPYRFKAIDGKLAWVNSETDEVIDISPSGTSDLVTAIPIIDTKASDFDITAYKQDSQECRDLARRVRDRTLETAIGSAIVGAATGAAVGAAVGIPKAGAMVGAAGAGIPGLAAGYSGTLQGRTLVLVRCLEGRGYAVLGVE